MLAFRISLFAVAAAALTACAAGTTTPSTSNGFGAPAAVAAAKPGPLKVSPGALNFTTAPTLKLKVSESNYTGPFTIAGTNGLIKLKPTKLKGPKATVTATAVNAGKTTLTVSDNHGGSKSVSVTVTQGVIIIQ